MTYLIMRAIAYGFEALVAAGVIVWAFRKPAR